MPTFAPTSPGKTLSTMGIVINGVSVIDPSELQWTIQDISAPDAGRDEAGTMHPMKIGQKRTVQLGWNHIDPANAMAILAAISGNAQTFTATLPDALTGALRQGTYYVGDRQAPMKIWNATKLDGQLYSKLSFTLIEV